MRVIVCLDERDGMLFHNRRQSRDRVVIQDILQLCKGRKLWMNAFSAKLFQESEQILVDESCLDKAGAGEYCLVENLPLAPYERKIEELIIYRWNRHYPADQSFDISLDGWNLTGVLEQAGFSHEKITREMYAAPDKSGKAVANR